MKKLFSCNIEFEHTPGGIGVNDMYFNRKTPQKGKRGRILNPKTVAYKNFIKERLKEKVFKTGFELLTKKDFGKRSIFYELDLVIGNTNEMDVDGLIKAFQDCPKGILWEDDSQVITFDPGVPEFPEKDGMTIGFTIYEFNMEDFIRGRKARHQ